MSFNLVPSTVILFTLLSLSFLGFFIGGGIFAANVEIPEAIGSIGGACFFLWWLPALIALVSRNAINRLKFTQFGSITTVTGCVFILVGGIVFFVSALLLSSGPITPKAQEIGDLCLGTWWIPGVIGVAFLVLTVIYELAKQNIGDTE